MEPNQPQETETVTETTTVTETESFPDPSQPQSQSDNSEPDDSPAAQIHTETDLQTASDRVEGGEPQSGDVSDQVGSHDAPSTDSGVATEPGAVSEQHRVDGQ